MKQEKWKLRTFSNIDYNDIDSSQLLNEMLKSRGIEDPEAWKNVSKEDENEASLLKNIEQGAKILFDTINNNKKVYLQIDADADGLTSSAILYKFLESLSDCEIVVGIHPGKEHGLNISEALNSGAEVVLVPDASGIPADYETLNAKGIPSLIIDHHDYPEEEFPTVVINCRFAPYPNHALSGAGVVLKVCQYYCETYGVENYDFNPLYALASIGMVADVMDLQVLENQYIIKYGLQHILRHRFFGEMLKDRMGNLPKAVTIKDIGWSIGPSINAVIRLGTMEEKRMLFNATVAPMTNTESKKRGAAGEIVPLYVEMSRICKNIKAKQTRLVQGAVQDIEESLDHNHNILCYIDEEGRLPFELSGLIANKLLSTHGKPILLLKHFHDYSDPTMPDCWAGSVRAKSSVGFENPREILSQFSGVRESGGRSIMALTSFCP